jgi:type I restriction enzyme S subunit
MAEQRKKKVPPIRFKGFSDEWDEKPIGEVLTEKKRPIELEDNKLYELVTVRRRNGGVVSRGYLQGKDILVKNYSQLRAGDFIISKRQVVHGATGIVPQHLDKAIVSNEYMVAVGNENISSEFLTIISTLPDMYRKFFLSSYGVDIEKLFFDAADWKKRNVVLPKLPEQNEICSYFAELDQMIGLHQRKHEKLVTLKIAMLKKMFPQNGATTPEIRFKGFSEPWEEKKFGETGEFNPKAELPEIFEYVDLESVVGTQLVAHRTETKHTAPSRAQRLAQQGDLFFQTVRPYQKNNHLFAAPDKNYVFSTGYAQIRPFGDGSFLLGLVQGEGFLQTVLDNCTGTSYPAINSNTLAEILVCIPFPKEQQKIGTYFRQMDKLIAQHGTQVEKLKQIKTACLEKMFV